MGNNADGNTAVKWKKNKKMLADDSVDGLLVLHLQ